MDPYLESPTLWPEVHRGLICQIRAELNSNLRPLYEVRVEMRAYLSDKDDPGREALVPCADTRSCALVDEEIQEAFLNIIHVTSEDLVAVIEVLSPANKIRGSRGRASFMARRHHILKSEVHWVEIDLLRAGAPLATNPRFPASDYRILISRGDQRKHTRYWPVSVRQALPVVGIPLRGKDRDVPLDLGAVLRTAYDQADYGASVDYRKPPQPPLEGEDAMWAGELLRARGAR
jgi:hypothetical protein